MARRRRAADRDLVPRARLGDAALSGDDERGSAVVETALVVPLLVLVAAAVLQVALALHVRATLTAAAAEGARAAALSGAGAAAAVRRVESLTSGTVAGSAMRDVEVRRAVRDGLPVVEVTIEAALPMLGLLGPAGLEVSGHALREDWP